MNVRTFGLHAFIMGVLIITTVIFWLERQIGEGDEAELFIWLLPLHQQQRLEMFFEVGKFLILIGASMDALGRWLHIIGN